MVCEKNKATVVSRRLHLVAKPFDQRPRKFAGWADSRNVANNGDVLDDRKTKRIVASVETYNPPELVLQTEKARLLAVATTFIGAGDSQSGEKQFEVCVSIGVHLVVAIHGKAAN